MDCKIINKILSPVLLTAALTASATVNPTDEERAKCFMDNVDDQTVTFIMDNNLWKVSGINKLEVFGSFTSWSSSPAFNMTYDSEGDFWYVTVPYADVKIPGNSGQPEYKFVSNGSNYLNGGSKSFIPEGYVFLNGDKNNIVVFHDDDFETIKANSREANILKKVADFDLTTVEGQEAISNFRLVPGTTKLFRCYHPYKFSKTSNATEPVRLDYLTRLAVEHGAMCDICLSENESNNLKSYTIGGTTYKETIPEYYQAMIDNDRVLYVGAGSSVPSYNAVYYRSNNDTFGGWVKEIVDFILDDDHPAPFLIHCRLGTDRTGTFSGVLAALCGASWSEIAADYQLTNRMGIQEFRDYHLLQYSFQNMLSVEDINAVEDLSQAMRDYFVGKGFLTDDEISRLKAKLSDSSGVETLSAGTDESAAFSFNPATREFVVGGETKVGSVALYLPTGAQVASLPLSSGRASAAGIAPGIYLARLASGLPVLKVILR